MPKKITLGWSHFFPPRPLPYFPCLLSCLVTSHLLRDSLCIALQTGKIMDLINWSLNAIDTIFSTRSLGSGEPTALTERCSWLHDGRVGKVAYRVFSGSFRGGHWRYLPIRNHDNRSFADRIRLCLGYRRIQKREQLSKASQGCPSWLKQWEERSALRLRLLTAIWILSWRAHCFAKENRRYRRPEWTKRVAVELECGYSPQD